jgi:hypothetical protein
LAKKAFLHTASPKSRILYAALRAAQPEPLPLLTLAQLVWQGEARPANPTAALRMQVHRLREGLCQSAIDEDVKYVQREGAPPGWRLTRRGAARFLPVSGLKPA